MILQAFFKAAGDFRSYAKSGKVNLLPRIQDNLYIIYEFYNYFLPEVKLRTEGTERCNF